MVEEMVGALFVGGPLHGKQLPIPATAEEWRINIFHQHPDWYLENLKEELLVYQVGIYKRIWMGDERTPGAVLAWDKVITKNFPKEK